MTVQENEMKNLLKLHDLKRFTILFLFITFIICSIDSSAGCMYENPGHEKVDRGEVVYYYVKVTNNDYPLGVDIRIGIDQTESRFVAKNTEFTLEYGRTDSCHIYVYTDNFEGEVIWTNTTSNERGRQEDSFHVGNHHYFRTTFNQPAPDPVPEANGDSQNIFLGVLTLSILGVVFITLYQYRHVVMIRGYTLLKKEEILDNENRKDIYSLICEQQSGLTTTEIGRELGLQHHRLVQYHLNKLSENGYVRKVDRRYFPNRIHAVEPFIEQINNAMMDGASTPSEIARKIGSYHNKVKRYMKKHGIWKKKRKW